MKILITGGPVHAKLDAVKIITNRFRGGLMADLAQKCFTDWMEVTYLTSKGSVYPRCDNHRIVFHDGFHDYRTKVLELAPQMDAVVLGAAVCNLIPHTPFEGKFPSHLYKVGELIPIQFVIAPRVIDEVKKVAPKTHLFGFKLLSNVPMDELITAAYGVLLESKATAVFANDALNLSYKYAVTKERAIHPMDNAQMVDFIRDCVNDEYYKTVVLDFSYNFPSKEDSLGAQKEFDILASRYSTKFPKNHEGYVFGTIAVKYALGGDSNVFLTTGRGKEELKDRVDVIHVNHVNKIVSTGGKKATLNAPLLDYLFWTNPKVKAIVHFHSVEPNLPQVLYAIPGTVRDSKRDMHTSFVIQNHGTFLLLDKNLNVL